MELDLVQVPPARAVTGSGRVTRLRRINLPACTPGGEVQATLGLAGTTNGVTFDGELTVLEPLAGLQAALPYMGTLTAGPGGPATIDGTFVFPDIAGTFQLDRLEP